jgi:hypothetical protein
MQDQTGKLIQYSSMDIDVLLSRFLTSQPTGDVFMCACIVSVLIARPLPSP